ncbi:MAG: methyltransferase domain-containing protein [Actinobacteria bacterium]|nr:methyltransferase domain-containing protein [Actinomycetota bacterium]MCG2803539.1 methyltransferase domain-containing protein [Cellulomonas sp.]
MTTSAHDPAHRDVYTHGHHEAVLRSHRWRTAANSAAYLVPELEPGFRLLDVGAGPGTISIDLARYVAQVVGVDASAQVVAQAQAAAHEAGATNVRFEVGDAYQLAFDDDSFDVVHAHQVLQHLSDPVAALREMRRVTRPGGIVAVRDSDYSAMTWYPPSAGMDRWRELYLQVTRSNQADADAGRKLAAWVRAAGFDPAGIVADAGVWSFASPADRSWWSQLWAERSVSSDFAHQAVERQLADDGVLEQIAAAWRTWGQEPDGWFAVLHGQVLARA